ncbi:MAG: hypothetical protein F4049_13070 [Gemmatimonadetes bacterium]|nr:hypothetical protein [Gemmatimonadota bacterium]
MNFKTLFAFILILVGICDSSAQDDPVYARYKSYKSLRMTYEDLSNLLLTTQEFLTNSAVDSSYVHRDRVLVENKSEKLTISGNYQLEEFKKAPTRATYAWYQFSASNHPIEDVEISLRDYQREVEIVGSSLAQVQALSAMIHEHLETKETIFGAEFRTLGKALFFATFLSLAVLNFIINREKVNNANLSIVTVIMCPIYLCILFVFPLEDWLPGTAIYMDTAGFLEKYSPEVTFFGAICGLISLFVPFFWRKVRERQNRRTTQTD